MRAIIIEEERFTEVCDLMNAVPHRPDGSHWDKPDGISNEHWEQALQQAHRTINYVFVRWAQSHGASCTKR